MQKDFASFSFLSRIFFLFETVSSARFAGSAKDLVSRLGCWVGAKTPSL
jgi:hypothetical protein